MKVFLSIVGLLCLGTAANAQGMQWFTPNDFELTCPIFEKCVRETECEAFADKLTIRHAPNEGPTHFELPGQLSSTGVLGVIASLQGQAVMASASPDGQRFYRMIVFPDGDVTVAVLNTGTKSDDVNYYGNCTEAVG